MYSDLRGAAGPRSTFFLTYLKGCAVVNVSIIVKNTLVNVSLFVKNTLLAATAKNTLIFNSGSEKCLINVQPHPFFILSFIVMFFCAIFPSVVDFFALLVNIGANFLRDWCALQRLVTYFSLALTWYSYLVGLSLYLAA